MKAKGGTFKKTQSLFFKKDPEGKKKHFLKYLRNQEASLCLNFD